MSLPSAYHRVYWRTYIGLRSLQWRYARRERDWIFGRIACMGWHVLNLLGIRFPVFNIQKGRVDYIVNVASSPLIAARTERVAPFMERYDILPLIAQQESLGFIPNRQPVALYMDSFSELTDRLFVCRNGQWCFCCHYSDLHHGPEFTRLFDAAGLLEASTLLVYYQRFFGLFRQMYGDIPIIFLHFPVALEKRELYRQRAQSILATISELSSQFKPFYSVAIDDAQVGASEISSADVEGFPYHFSRRTLEAFANEVRRTGVFG
jgi:hypothetical protein